MKLLLALCLLATYDVVSAGIIGPAEPDAISSAPCGEATPTTLTVISTKNQTHVATVTETEYSTINAGPGTVTVALQGPEAISSSLRSAFSVESQQLEIISQLAPINPLTSGHPPSSASPTHFTRTIVVPIIEATKTATYVGLSSATDVYFIGESNGTTTWLTNFTPQESMTIGTTTVTLSPVPHSSTSRPEQSRLTRHATNTNTVTVTAGRTVASSAVTAGGFTGTRDGGWNSSVVEPASAGLSSYTSVERSAEPPASSTLVTLRRSSSASATTITTPLSASPTSINLGTDAYGSTINITFPTATYDYKKRSPEDVRRRLVCEWITATMRGTPVSWPNNWDGSKTVDCAASTVQPQPPPPPTSATITVVATSTPTTNEAISPASAAETHTLVAVSPAATDSAPAATSSCGVAGDFVLDFDTLPQFYPPNNDTAPFPPIFNPYRHLFFSSGWAYVPPPTTPVAPQNGSHLAVYVPSAPETNSSVSQSHDAGDVPPGSFGAGPRAYSNAYWFDVETLYVFCDNGATDLAVMCDVVATAYQWDDATKSEKVVGTQHFPQPPCPGFRSCQTNEIFLDHRFRRLTSLSLYAVVNGQQKLFLMDTVQLTWWNNTCEAGLLRASQN